MGSEMCIRDSTKVCERVSTLTVRPSRKTLPRKQTSQGCVPSFLGESFRPPSHRWTRPSNLRRIPQIRLVNERAGVDPLIRPSLPSALRRKGQTIAVRGCVASAPPLTKSDNCRTLVPNRHVPLAKKTRHSHSFGASIRSSLAIRLLSGHVRSVGAPGFASCSFVALVFGGGWSYRLVLRRQRTITCQ